ncbi:hypothetical protein ACJX0J_040320, partial [Zea mays]
QPKIYLWGKSGCIPGTSLLEKATTKMISYTAFLITKRLIFVFTFLFWPLIIILDKAFTCFLFLEKEKELEIQYPFALLYSIISQQTHI